MIRRKRFDKIYSEIEDAVNEAFDYVMNNSIKYKYILLLADADFNENYINTINPYVIDSQIHKYQDESRLGFLMSFLNRYYSFEKVEETNDDLYSLMIEMMIYTHIWESVAYLKQLNRISQLVCYDRYPWRIDVPEKSKHDFIRKKIKTDFESKKLNIAKIISKGFHTSLRNAFAHSQFGIDENSNLIYLDTFKGETWNIRSISFND